MHLQGSSASIGKATLAHWMRVKLGVDYLTNIGTPAPLGLVSEPADYPRCAAAASKIVPREQSGKPKLSGAQIKRKCQQLYQAIKEQVLSSLITAQWTAVEASKAGVHVSAAALHGNFERYRDQDMPSEAQLHKYLTDRHWSISDILFERKQSLLLIGLTPKLEAESKRAGGGEAGYAKVILAHQRKQLAETSCQKGYVVPGCKEYREPPGGPYAPNVILEAFVAGRASSRGYLE